MSYVCRTLIHTTQIQIVKNAGTTRILFRDQRRVLLRATQHFGEFFHDTYFPQQIGKKGFTDADL
jgi:hypothetical protein